MFKSKREKPEWRMVYDNLLANADYDSVISLPQLDSVLGRPFAKNRSPLYQARTHMGKVRKRWLEPVVGVGYRVIKANEHLDVAQQHKKRAKRQLGMMVKIGEFTDLSHLTDSELANFDQQRAINTALFMVVVHHEKRLQRIETLLRSEGRLLD